MALPEVTSGTKILSSWGNKIKDKIEDGEEYINTSEVRISNSAVQIRPSTATNTGGDCSGANAEENRVLTLSNTTLTSDELIFIQGSFVHPENYNIVHKTASTEVTFSSVGLYNDDKIVVRFKY